jgi:hypothetical protein
MHYRAVRCAGNHSEKPTHRASSIMPMPAREVAAWQVDQAEHKRTARFQR